MLDQYGHPSVVGQGAGWGECHRDALHSPALHTPTQHVRREDTTPVQGNLQTHKPGGEWSGMGDYMKCTYVPTYVCTYFLHALGHTNNSNAPGEHAYEYVLCANECMYVHTYIHMNMCALMP